MTRLSIKEYILIRKYSYWKDVFQNNLNIDHDYFLYIQYYAKLFVFIGLFEEKLLSTNQDLL